MNPVDIAVKTRLAEKRSERSQLKIDVLQLCYEYEQLQSQYNQIDRQYHMMLSLEKMVEFVEGPCQGKEDICLDKIMQAATERYGVALELEKETFLSLENFRESVKRKWKDIVEKIVEGISRFKKILLVMLGTIPRMRKRAEDMIAISHGLKDTGGDIYLAEDQLWLANKKKNNQMDPIGNCEILIKCLEDFLIGDHDAVRKSGIDTVGLLQDTKRLFSPRSNIEESGTRDSERAVQHLKSLLTASGMYARISDQHVPEGAWRKSVSVPGITSEQTLTFMADTQSLPGSRYILYRFPRFSSAQPDLLYSKEHKDVVSIAEAAVQRFSKARVGLVAIKPDKFDIEDHVNALTPSDIQKSAQLVIKICDLLERHHEQTEDMEKIKTRLIRVGNTAMGAITDGESPQRNKVSYMMRELIKYHGDRLERPYAALINLAVRTIEATMSYCEKSASFGIKA